MEVTDSHNVKPYTMKSNDGNILDRRDEETRKWKCLISELMYRTQIICHKKGLFGWTFAWYAVIEA